MARLDISERRAHCETDDPDDDRMDESPATVTGERLPAVLSRDSLDDEGFSMSVDLFADF